MLVSALAGGVNVLTTHDTTANPYIGRDFIFEAYIQAIENKYRFYSYGDCIYK